MLDKRKINLAKSLALLTKGEEPIKQLEIEQKFLSNHGNLSPKDMSDILDFATNFRQTNQPY